MAKLCETAADFSRGLTAEETLRALIDLLVFYLGELADVHADEPFLYGERTAYTECLELLQLWERAEEYGLDFEIEERYPL